MMKNLLLQKYISCHIKLFFLRKWVSIAYFPVKNDSFLFRVPDCNNSKIKGSPPPPLPTNTTSIILHRKQAAAMAGTNAASKLMKSVFEVLLSQEAKGFDRVLAKV